MFVSAASSAAEQLPPGPGVDRLQKLIFDVDDATATFWNKYVDKPAVVANRTVRRRKSK
jgi:hypothetical protein